MHSKISRVAGPETHPPPPLRAIPIILPTFLFHSLHLTYLSPLLSSMLICESPVIIGSESL